MHDPSHNAWAAGAAASATLMCLAIAGHGGDSDRALFMAINAHARACGAWCDALFHLGLGSTLLFLTTLLAAHRPQRWAAMVMALALSGVIVQLIKFGVDLPRPVGVLGTSVVQVIGETLYGRAMPSGHTAAAFSLLGVVMADRSGGPGSRLRLSLLLGGLALAIALSRVVSGAHWPSDVVAGAALGLALGLGAWRWSATARLSRRLGQGLSLAWIFSFSVLFACGAAWMAIRQNEPGLWLPALAAVASAGRCLPLSTLRPGST